MDWLGLTFWEGVTPVAWEEVARNHWKATFILPPETFATWVAGNLAQPFWDKGYLLLDAEVALKRIVLSMNHDHTIGLTQSAIQGWRVTVQVSKFNVEESTDTEGEADES